MKRNSLKTHFWLYFSIFSIIILILLWIFQMLFFNKYYEKTKNKNVSSVAKIVKKSYNSDHYQMVLDMLSYQKDVCIEIFTDNAIYYSSDSVSRGCVINDNEVVDMAKYHNHFVKSDKDIVSYQLFNSRYKTKVLVYGVKLENDTYAFISTSLVPIAETFNVWRNLFIYISVVVMLVSFLLAYFVSRRISRPIVKLNKTSKEMVKGNYNIRFDTNDSIVEINELATTLNNLNDELSKTEMLRRELMANVSHDLKTPLTLIRANAEMVKDINYNKKEKRNANLQVIIDEVNRLNLLVEDILSLSKAQSNTIDIKREVFDIDELIRTVLERFQVLVEKNNFNFNYKSIKNCIVYADIKKIEQVLYNLISNAVNYSSDKLINIRLKNKGQKVLIEISNSGDEITKEDLKHIWDKYYKVDKSYHRVTLGTGLGLSIVKNLLELHHFKYGVISNKKKTTFYFEMDKYEEVSNDSKNISEGRKKISN